MDQEHITLVTVLLTEDEAISASYTMGGMTISGGFNSSDNIAGSTSTTADKESYEIGLSFAF